MSKPVFFSHQCRIAVVSVSLLCPATLWAGDPPSSRQFKADVEAVSRLTCERVRAAHYDYQRVTKLGEERLRELHEQFKVAGGTPPTTLDGDVQSLRQRSQSVRMQRSRGRSVPADPEAEKLVFQSWERYRREFDGLLEDVLLRRRLGEPESRIYWDIMTRYESLKSATERQLLYNAMPPLLIQADETRSSPGRPHEDWSVEAVLARDLWRLLKAIETPGKKTRGPVTQVVAPGELSEAARFDVAPFYQSQGLLPTNSPHRVGGFIVPPGGRTVTVREKGLSLIYRVSKGRGLAYIGSEQQEMDYGYLLIPPDSPYYFENLTQDVLHLEYIALPL
ncbi:MAG TPA: hypothetical protein PK876_01685 [Elusimicrobiota bacterium]|nr:hypothetical protein [Elusimicrobiota bacterium]